MTQLQEHLLLNSRHQAHKWYTDVHASKIHAQIIYFVHMSVLPEYMGFTLVQCP